MIWRNRLVVDLNAFLDRAEVRRGEQAGAIADRSQHGREHGRGRAFAFAPGNVDDAQLLLRLIERPQQGAHLVELQVARLRRAALEIHAAVPPGQRFGVGHVLVLGAARKQTLRFRDFGCHAHRFGWACLTERMATQSRGHGTQA